MKEEDNDVTSTSHSGSVYLKNNWGINLSQVYLRHRIGNEKSKTNDKTWYNVKQGDTVGPMAITYETGIFSSYDYWWIKFVDIGSNVYKCKDDFYCSISSDDNGTVTVELVGDDSDMTLAFSESTGCSVTINKV